MRTSELLKLLKKNGVVFVRHGGNHDIYMNTRNGKQTAIPRHSQELCTSVVSKILRELGLK